MSRIEPRTLKGFRDYLPQAMIPRERIMETARRVYRSFGYAPIDTPALEYLEILTGKGSDETDKQLYRFQDHGGRDVGLRFDLTVPLARFVAQHSAELGLPFKRYHIATVWRGENTQRGRYREFMQCDFDTIGTTGVASDIETVLVVGELLRQIGLEKFTIRINHRGVLNGLLENAGLAEQSTAVLRSLDKLAKIGREATLAEIERTAGATKQQAEQVLALVDVTGDSEAMLVQLAALTAGSERGAAGVARLAEVIRAVEQTPNMAGRVQLDVSIARGLDYYTGLVLETTLDELPGIGSIASGGRYDNLASLYTSQELPGIGASLGLDRLLSALEELGRIPAVSTPAEVFLPYFAADKLSDYLRVASQLRAAGFGVEFYPEPKKLGNQLKYADKRGFRAAVIIGADEFAAGQCQLKNLSDGGSQTLPLEANAASLIAALAELVKKT